MEFKELRKLKKSIKAFFAKTDVESAIETIETRVNSAVETIEAKLNIAEIDRQSGGDLGINYDYLNAIRDLENAFSPKEQVNVKQNITKLMNFGFEDKFIFDKIKSNPKILEAEDEVELLKQTLNISEAQAEAMYNIKEEKMEEFNKNAQKQIFNYTLKHNDTWQNSLDIYPVQAPNIWQKTDLDTLYKPTGFVENLKYEYHKLSEGKKLDKLIDLVESNQMSIKEMRNFLADNSTILAQELTSSEGMLAIPDDLFFESLKSNKDLLVDNFARKHIVVDKIDSKKEESYQTLKPFYECASKIETAQHAIFFNCTYKNATELRQMTDSSSLYIYIDSDRIELLQDVMQTAYQAVSQQNQTEPTLEQSK